jgi:glutamate-1-semialdehyde 2,1-aminomutase
MEKIAPVGPVYQAGTLSGNPLAMAAGFAALKHIKENPGIYKELEEKSFYLENGFKATLNAVGKKYAMNRVGSMMCMFFTEETVDDFKSAVKSDTVLYGKYFHEMLERGIYLAPAQFEALFVSIAHSKEDLDKTITAHKESLEVLQR